MTVRLEIAAARRYYFAQVRLYASHRQTQLTLSIAVKGSCRFIFRLVYLGRYPDRRFFPLGTAVCPAVGSGPRRTEQEPPTASRFRRKQRP